MPVSATQLAQFGGLNCIAIGAAHLLGGIRAEPGVHDADPTIDSMDRFHGAIFLGYGGALYAAGRSNDVGAMNRLVGLMALGGAARLITLARGGRPHAFQHVLTAVEFVYPAAVFALNRRTLS